MLKLKFHHARGKQSSECSSSPSRTDDPEDDCTTLLRIVGHYTPRTLSHIIEEVDLLV